MKNMISRRSFLAAAGVVTAAEKAAAEKAE